MQYATVFEITQNPYQWWFAGAGLVAVALGGALFLAHRGLPGQRSLRVGGNSLVVFGLLWTISVLSATYPSYRRCAEAYRTHSYEVVEGTVTEFRPMPREGHEDERFRVGDVEFRYSDYGIEPGFSQSASHGGPIRDGLRVRIAHYEGRILRLEVAEMR